MAKIRSIKFNFIMNSILTLSTIIFPLITFPYVSRILLPVGTGKVSFATSVVACFSMFAQLGIPTYGIRACAQVRDDKEKLSRTVHEILFINLITCTIAYTTFFVALAFVPKLHEEKSLFIIISLMIIFNAIGVEWLYKALEQYSYITIRSIVFKFLALIAMFLLIHQQNDYVIYGGISILAGVASNIFNFINLRKLIIYHPIGKYNLKHHFKSIAIFFAMSIAIIVYTNLDTIILGFMKTDEDVGYYNAAVKIKSILATFVSSLGTVLLPRVSYYIEHEMNEEFKLITKKALNFVVLIACPSIVYFTIFAKEGILFLSGSAYIGSILPMQIMMISILFIGLSNITGMQMLVPLGRENIVLYAVIAGAISDVIICFLLIPQYASSGAAIGTLISEIVGFSIEFFVLRKQVASIFKKISYGKIFISLFIGVLASTWIKMFNLPNVIILIISGCLFFGVYGLVLNVLKETLVIELESQVLQEYIKKLKQ